jgi:formate C-acetyltransferase
MSFMFNHRPSLRRYLKSRYGWLNFSVGIRTEGNTVRRSITFKDGRVTVSKDIGSDTDVQMIFVDDKTLIDMTKIPPGEVFNLLLKNRMIIEGNLGYIALFNFLISLLLKKKQIRMMEKEKRREGQYYAAFGGRSLEEIQKSSNDIHRGKDAQSKRSLLKAESIDPGVKFLSEPYLSAYTLDNFPRLKGFLDIHLNLKPEICHERPKILTDWFA